MQIDILVRETIDNVTLATDFPDHYMRWLREQFNELTPEIIARHAKHNPMFVALDRIEITDDVLRSIASELTEPHIIVFTIDPTTLDDDRYVIPNDDWSHSAYGVMVEDQVVLVPWDEEWSMELSDEE